MEKEYTLIAFGKRIPVSKAVYQTYYKAYEKERYQEKLRKTKALSFDCLVADGMSVESHQFLKMDSLETYLDKKEKVLLLNNALDLLTSEERERFLALAYGEMTERALAEKYQMTKSQIHREKIKNAKILRRFLSAHLS